MSDTMIGVLTLLAMALGAAAGLAFVVKVLIPAHKAAGKHVRRNGEWIGPDHPDYPR